MLILTSTLPFVTWQDTDRPTLISLFYTFAELPELGINAREFDPDSGKLALRWSGASNPRTKSERCLHFIWRL